jgi:hypothetical protein
MDVSATVEGIRAYLIHSEEYRVVYFSRDDDPDAIHNAQLSADAVPSGLAVGDRITVQYLLNIVVAIRRA